MIKIKKIFEIMKNFFNNEKMKKTEVVFNPETMTEAQTFFDTVEKNLKSKTLALDYEKALSWEEELASIYSKEIIHNEENVARQLYSPHSYDKETGMLTTLALDDVFNKGLSVNRLSMVDPEDIHAMGKEKIEKAKEENPDTDKEYIGFSEVTVIKIRECTEDKDKRWFAVYDTANLDDVSHGDVCCIFPPDGTPGRKNIKKRQREKLRDVFSKVKKTTS